MSSMTAIRRSRRRSRDTPTTIIARENLKTADMRILAILVVLHHAHLNHHGFQHIARVGIVRILRTIAVLALEFILPGVFTPGISIGIVAAVPRLPPGTFRPAPAPCHIIAYPASIPASDTFEGHINPAAGRVAFPGCKLDEVVAAHAGQENHFGRCVALVEVEVEVHADPDDSDQFEEVQG
jgi:hypothetical protein